MRRLLPLLPLLLAAAPGAPAARAAGFDEFQVFDGRITQPGGFDLNLHLNFGRRGIREAGEGAPRNGALFTAEIGYVTAPWHEVALYLPVAREFSGDVFGGGFKLRNSFVVPGAADRPVAYGFDVELRHQPYRFTSADWGVTLRPIIDLRRGPWQLILNPAVEFPLGRDGPVFAPAVRGVLQVAEQHWIGLEHYMDFDRIDRPAKPGGQAHQLFATTDWKISERFALHLGLGHGLTRASDRWLGKVILSVDF
ncbi:hypothetical protein [Paracraurococcus ruber]|uniref:Transporter n=1 Tax=Paracraurococcus ruber TaxID=77675 RepID=A0ABS1D2G0_9PROT|nr:hypothetical protein [Paracraurococcus ruber]MBK1660736.1 hypothetical protein [Paracraurococcus ruber]TDG26929.1 hypothetical protein E2C05_24640 [Paracraurococcus ruber]